MGPSPPPFPARSRPRDPLARREELGLDELEVLITRYTVYEHVTMIGVALLSVVVVLTLAYVVRIPVAATGFMAGLLQTGAGTPSRPPRARAARPRPGRAEHRHRAGLTSARSRSRPPSRPTRS
jgi:hypothetical protein